MPRKHEKRRRKKKIDLRAWGEEERKRLASLPLFDRQRELYNKHIKGRVKIENRRDKLTKFVSQERAFVLLDRGVISFDPVREVYYE